jgi:hypothetical protein
MNTRAKGVAFEREVARMFEDAGGQVRGLESGGDHLIRLNGVTFSSECKTQLRVSVPEWWDQTVLDAVEGAVPLLTFTLPRASRRRREILSLSRTADLLRLIA